MTVAPPEGTSFRGTSRFVEANGLRLHFLEYGKGNTPSVVIVPGITSPAVTWEFVAVELAGDFHVLVMDVRGRGLSDHPREGFSTRDYADDLAASIDALGLERPVVLGHSMGARIAAAFGCWYPDRRGPLIVADPPLSGPGRDPYPISVETFLESIRQAQAGATAEDMRPYFPTWTDEQLELRARWLGTCDMAAVSETHRRFHEEDFLDYWRPLAPPLLFLWGAESNAVTAEGAREVLAANPSAEAAVIEGAGHMLPFDALEAFLAPVRAFVRRVAGDFPDPFEVAPPASAEDWRRLYPYYVLFSEDRREFEREKFWFWDSMHYPGPQYPFDTIMWEHTWVILNQNTTRFFRVPSALGIDHRVVNGYVYLSPNTVEDPDEVQRRLEHFSKRAGHYFEHWDDIYGEWVEKATDCRQRLIDIEFRPLPEVEPEALVHAAQPLGSGFRLYEAYSRLLENVQEMAYLHFDMLGLGYGAYLTFRDFCHQAFPGISDQSVARMVAGIDIMMFRPDDELRRLARLAVKLGVGNELKGASSPDAALEAIASKPGGDAWIAALEDAKDPWFWFSTGAGLGHEDPAWMDDMTIPFGVMGTYVERIEAGEDVERPLDRVREEAARITSEYRQALASDGDRATFDELVALARTVYPFVENHNFYCEHQHYSIFWNKVRDLGAVFAHHGYLDDADDVFMLHRFEIHQALWDLETGWACETPDRRDHWKREIAERRRILEALRGWSPPPALGRRPETVTEPFTVMLWGITTETLDRWQQAGAGDGDVRQLHGVAAAPGVAEGPARVILSPSELDAVRPGEILVCPITAPSWAPVFAKIGAAVSDIGGIMAHAAIVSREYGLPAVVGTGFGTQTIKTGQTVRVDGHAGVVTILD